MTAESSVSKKNWITPVKPNCTRWSMRREYSKCEIAFYRPLKHSLLSDQCNDTFPHDKQVNWRWVFAEYYPLLWPYFWHWSYAWKDLPNITYITDVNEAVHCLSRRFCHLRLASASHLPAGWSAGLCHLWHAIRSYLWLDIHLQRQHISCRFTSAYSYPFSHSCRFVQELGGGSKGRPCGRVATCRRPTRVHPPRRVCKARLRPYLAVV